MMKKLGTWLCAVCCVLCAALPARADESDNAALKAEIEVLKERLGKLEAKVKEAPVAAQPRAEKAGEAVLRHHAVYEPPSEQVPALVWPVPGIYTAPGTKDLGTLTGISWLAGTKLRGWIDTNYVINFNHPDRTTVNTNQSSSVVKGRNVSIEGRTFDIHDQSFNLSLAELEIEKVPEVGGVGFKFDLAFGETQDIIVDTIKGTLSGTGVGTESSADSVTDFDKTFQHASVSYIAPLGRGLRFDAGKFVTHIGGETIETAKNWNYSHSFFYTYAIPFQDTGIHVSYPWSDTLYTDFYLLNGWNVTIDNNKGKTMGPSIGWTPLSWLSLCTSYLGGPEQNDTGKNMRHLWDTQIFLGPFDRWNFMINYDLGHERNALTGGTRNATWQGVTGYARYKVNDWFEPSFRLEYFKDHDGFQTGLDQGLVGATLTLNTKLGLGKNKASMVLVRPELRYDHSGDKFFTDKRKFRSERGQWTLGAGVTWLF